MCTSTATSSSPVGTYDSSCSGASDPNYTISYTDGNVVVGRPAGHHRLVGNDDLRRRGPTITPSYSGFVNGDTAASLTTQPTCSTTATSSSSVGTYASTCSGAADPNYMISLRERRMWSSEPRRLVIAASSGSMTYGGNPADHHSVLFGLRER